MSQQFAIDLRDLFQMLLHLVIVLDPGPDAAVINYVCPSRERGPRETRHTPAVLQRLRPRARAGNHCELAIFDSRLNFYFQGFSGRRATTTHDATSTFVSISGIFRATEDFAVLSLYNARDTSITFASNRCRARISSS